MGIMNEMCAYAGHMLKTAKNGGASAVSKKLAARTAAAVVGAALLGGLPATASADPINLVQNGGFEDNSGFVTPTDWTLTPASGGSSFYIRNDPTRAASGNNAAQFGSSADYGSNDDVISQVLPTVAGQQYDISLDYANYYNSSPSSNITVTLGGVTLLDENGVPATLVPTLAGGTGYNVFSEIITADAANEELTIGAGNGPSVMYVDDVSVTAVTTTQVPEPGTLLLVGAGFLGAIGFAARKRLAAKNGQELLTAKAA